MSGRRRVVIAGGGVAGLEAMLALRKLGSDSFDLELVAPEPRFWYRPLAVAEPFERGEARSFDLAELAERAGALVTLDSVVGVDSREHVALTERGARIPYESLLLACGASPQAVVGGALTFRGPADTDLLADVIARVDRGDVTRVAVVVPAGLVWSLPAYELALMLASHAEAARLGDLQVALVTPEDEPLELFGREAVDTIRGLLERHQVALHTGFLATEVHDGKLQLLPPRELECDCVVALPLLRGQQIDGVPQTRDGFVLVDDHGRVDGLPDVYAAGDITRFPIKQGGIATQQADAAAEAIAADARLLRDPKPFRPILRGVLLTGGSPRYLRRDVGAGQVGTAAVEPLWWPPSKIVGKHLAPFLASLVDARHDDEPPAGLAVDVELVARPQPQDLESDEGPSVGELLGSQPLLVVAPEDTLGEVAERMQALDVGSALVTDFGRLIGILTARDLLRAFAGRIHSSESRVREWMTADPISAPPTASLATALRLMEEHRIHHLPIVEDGRLAGMVGMRAVARLLADRPSVGLGF